MTYVTVLVFYGCHNKWPQTRWLKNISLSSGGHKSQIMVSAVLVPSGGSGRTTPVPLSWLSVALCSPCCLGYRCITAVSLPLSWHGFPNGLLFFILQGQCRWSHDDSINSVISLETLFPNMITFTGSKQTCLFVGHFNPLKLPKEILGYIS